MSISVRCHRPTSVVHPVVIEDIHSEASVSEEELHGIVSDAVNSLPIPSAALDVYHLANSDQIDAKQLANAIAKNELLANEVTWLANSPFYNRAGANVAGLDRAVVRIGQKRIGQLALAANAIAALAPNGETAFADGTIVTWRPQVSGCG